MIEKLKIVPSLDQEIGIRFAKTHYKATDDFLGIIKAMKPKIRFVYIPIGLPAKTGRKAAYIKTYQDLIETYDIPERGASF